MKICPKCKSGLIMIEPVLVADKTESETPSKKISASAKAKASCTNCALSVTGRLENPVLGDDGIFTGGHFVEERDGKDK